MYIKEKTLDDLLHRVISKLLTTKSRIDATRGEGTELLGVLLKLTEPRARLSRTEKKGHVFSCFGELLWYLAGTNDVQFISYYVPQYEEETDDGHTIYGGYGPRLFNMRGNDQVGNVLSLLRRKPDSRRAVIQLFDSEDIAPVYPKRHKDIPCTCTLQFMIRGRRLHMLTYMRSNDAFLGLPHDVFAFTMLQEIVARSLGIEPGTYNHLIGSLHLYDKHREDAKQYLSEGWQDQILMPPMPGGDPWRSIRTVLDAEHAIRNGESVDVASLNLESYWADVIRLLQIFRHFTLGEATEISAIKKGMVSRIYDSYIEQKKRTAKKREQSERPVQLRLI